MQYSKEELNEAYRKLPEELKEVFFSVDVTDSISDIGKKYNLHIDQIGELDSETGLVLLGLTHPTDFVSSLAKRLGIDRVLASRVAADVNDQVFLKVRGLLKNIGEDKPETGSIRSLTPGEFAPNPVSGLSTHPTRDALLAAIENHYGADKKPAPPAPEIPLVEIKNPYAPANPEIGKDVPVVAPVPKTDIVSQKLAGQFSMPTVVSTQKVDPYRESIN